MQILRTLPLILILGLSSGLPDPAVAAIPDEPGVSALSQIEILGSAFGLFSTEGAQPTFSVGSVVPLVEGQAYGWVIKVATSRKKLRWREELTLPESPATWGEPESIGTRKLSDDSRVSSTERTVEPVDGVLFNTWAVAKGDPPGHYKIRVFVEDQLAATFDFDVR